MRGVAKQFAVVFFVGFIAIAVALAISSVVTGSLLDNQPSLVALRSFGLGLMAAGMVLWIALRRDEAGRPELNPLLAMMTGSGCVALLLSLFFPFSPIAVYLMWSGVGLTLGALVFGILAMLINPAYPKPIAVRWPEGGAAQMNTHAPAAIPQGAVSHPLRPDDLTRIEGIGPKVQKILNQAGISRYAELASHTPDSLKEVLKGASFKGPVNAGSWPEQAELASKGDWSGLEALQKQLRAARHSH